MCVRVRALTNDDVIGVAGLRHLLDEEVHHTPEVVVLALEQLRHAEKHLISKKSKGGRVTMKHLTHHPDRKRAEQFDGYNFLLSRLVWPSALGATGKEQQENKATQRPEHCPKSGNLNVRHDSYHP